MDTSNDNFDISKFSFKNNLFKKIQESFFKQPRETRPDETDVANVIVKKFENSALKDLFSKSCFNLNVFDYPIPEQVGDEDSNKQDKTPSEVMETNIKFNPTEPMLISDSSRDSKSGIDKLESTLTDSVDNEYVISLDYNARETSFPVDAGRSSSHSPTRTDIIGVKVRLSSDNVDSIEKQIDQNMLDLKLSCINKTRQITLADSSVQYDSVFVKEMECQTGDFFKMLNVEDFKGPQLFPGKTQQDTITYESDMPIYLTIGDRRDKNTLKIQLLDLAEEGSFDESLVCNEHILSSKKEFNKVIHLDNHVFNVINEHTSLKHFKLTIYDITPSVSQRNLNTTCNTLNNHITNISSASSLMSDKSICKKSTQKHPLSDNSFNPCAASRTCNRYSDSNYFRTTKGKTNNSLVDFHYSKCSSREHGNSDHFKLDSIAEEPNEASSGVMLKKMSENFIKHFPHPQIAVYSSVSEFKGDPMHRKSNNYSVFKHEQKTISEPLKTRSQSKDYIYNPYYSKYLYNTLM